MRATTVVRMAPEISDEALLTRNATAAVLTDAGYPTSPATLATKATRGGGPPFRRFGPRPLYRWGDALLWARSRLGPLICSTSEPDFRSPSSLSLTEAGSTSKAEKPHAKCDRHGAVRAVDPPVGNVAKNGAVRRGQPRKKSPAAREASAIA